MCLFYCLYIFCFWSCEDLIGFVRILFTCLNVGLRLVSPIHHQAITWTNAGFSFTNMHLKMSSIKWQLCCCSHKVLNLKIFVCVYTGVKYGLKLPEMSFHCAVYSPRKQFSVTLNPRSHFSRLNGRKVQPLNPRDGGMKWTCLCFGLHVTVIINTTSNFLKQKPR